jgi:alpha-L-fucosidase 2
MLCCRPDGRVKGLRARGGSEADIAWKGGKLIAAVIHSLTGTACRLRYGGQLITLNLKPGAVVNLDEKLMVKVQS